MKRLGKKQTFDIFMWILMQLYCLIPWIPAKNGRINIFRYLYLCIKSGKHFSMFQTAFLRYTDRLQYLSEYDRKDIMIEAEAVAYCFIFALAIMMIMQLLNLACIVFSVRKYRGASLLSYGRMIVFMFLAAVVGNADQSGAFMYEWESRIYFISGNIFIYLNLFLIAEIILLVIGYFLKESEEASRLLAEERRKAQFHHQKVMENYIFNLEQMVDEMKAFQHDYKNIMSTMSGYIRENQMDKLRDFFREKIQAAPGNSEMQMKAWQSLRNIGPMELKGFLYEKLLYVIARRIIVQADISENLDVKYPDMDDLIRILGIFIDNAVEEAEKSVGGEVGIVIARTGKGVLFRIENTFAQKPEISQIGKKGYTTKGVGRGMGLYWAEERIRSHEDMFHELNVTDEKFIQLLEVIL